MGKVITHQSEEEPESEKNKLAVPDDAAQAKSLAAIRDIYKGDYQDKDALAVKMFQRAKETQDATDRFVLLREAKDLAADTWQGELAFDAIDMMAMVYEVSVSEMKAEVIEKAAKKPRITPEQKTAIAQAASGVVDEAVAEDNFDVAKRAGGLASSLVRFSKDKDLLKELLAKNREVDAAAKAYADAEEAMATLEDNPSDSDANLVVGKYLCFNKGAWKKGLSMLALGSDEILKALAEKDIRAVASTISAKDQVKLGDGWWDAGVKERAAYWYESALPGLAGLERDRVEKKLADSADRLPKALGEMQKKLTNETIGKTPKDKRPVPNAASRIKRIKARAYQFTDEKSILKDWELQGEQWRLEPYGIRIKDYNTVLQSKARLQGDISICVRFSPIGCQLRIRVNGETFLCDFKSVGTATVVRKGDSLVFTDGTSAPVKVILKRSQLEMATPLELDIGRGSNVNQGVLIRNILIEAAIADVAPQQRR